MNIFECTGLEFLSPVCGVVLLNLRLQAVLLFMRIELSLHLTSKVEATVIVELQGIAFSCFVPPFGVKFYQVLRRV